jgi:hypothetical protein
MQIQITQLGLAAYVQMKGAKLLRTEKKVFHFESEKTAGEWRTEYANSESMKHDALVCELRQHLHS